MTKPVVGTATEPLPCIGVVLAGGLSSRMGRDKALLDWQGRPLIERQLAVLREAGIDDVRVSGHRPGYHGVVDAMPQAGPLGGLAGIADALVSDAELLVIPVDMPLLHAALLRRLRDEQPHARCLRFAGHVLPMRWHLDAHSRSMLLALLQRDDPRQRSLRALQAATGSSEIALNVAEATQLTDCNTQANWNEVAG
ncbi:molybdenum cofactor guanylyltransferase [Rhodanobacter sp. B2A1Ga4]|uniref:molybdenum cofactor guanylyltransferase n=1 Tax=Rhodanobacter sp. B2A1Ga4 TaxID=2778647 RepID=UPI001B38550B|nr:molybdenum cofactor guanylyltransferase [Rhodanobacter sp. B2A1Ga4]MBQ4855860.1 molybdenum cofactor guanylyltransferase [Rhodanobacter sp. B2A1Ga4]